MAKSPILLIAVGPSTNLPTTDDTHYRVPAYFLKDFFKYQVDAAVLLRKSTFTVSQFIEFSLEKKFMKKIRIENLSEPYVIQIRYTSPDETITVNEGALYGARVMKEQADYRMHQLSLEVGRFFVKSKS